MSKTAIHTLLLELRTQEPVDQQDMADVIHDMLNVSSIEMPDETMAAVQPGSLVVTPVREPPIRLLWVALSELVDQTKNCDGTAQMNLDPAERLLADLRPLLGDTAAQAQPKDI